MRRARWLENSQCGFAALHSALCLPKVPARVWMMMMMMMMGGDCCCSCCIYGTTVLRPQGIKRVMIRPSQVPWTWTQFNSCKLHRLAGWLACLLACLLSCSCCVATLKLALRRPGESARLELAISPSKLPPPPNRLSTCSLVVPTVVLFLLRSSKFTTEVTSCCW